MRKLKYKNVFLLFGILIFVLSISVTYAALNTNMIIDGSAYVRADEEIRITDLKLLNGNNGGSELYNSKYTKDTITTGFFLPNDNSTISYKVILTNKSVNKYIINNIKILSSNNENIDFTSNYTEKEIIDPNSLKEIELTFNTKKGSENKNAIVIEFEFTKAFTITFNPNGGNVDITNKIVYENDIYGDLPVPTKKDYIFLGWYTKIENGEKIQRNTKVDLSKDQTLYARWGTSYVYEGDYVFDGTNYIDTGMYLFSKDNVDKDFEISFEITELDTKSNNATMVSAMSEKGSPWPGLVYRLRDTSGLKYQLAANASSSSKTEKFYNTTGINKVSIKKMNQYLYISYNDDYVEELINFKDIVNNTFDVPITFGAGLDSNGKPFRYFKGILSNMSVVYYTDGAKVTYDSNNGTGTTYKQVFLGNNSYKLKSNPFSNGSKQFIGWNTKKDGTGISYKDEDIIKTTSRYENITLYAQWSGIKYSIKYDSNGGIGQMPDQEFDSEIAKELLSNTFTKEGKKFLQWNTKKDGTGIVYDDKELIKEITNVEGQVITLYAQWGSIIEYAGDNIFDGKNYIDTGLKLFSQEYIDRDFEISFEIKNYNFNGTETIVNLMDEKASPWPGFVYRIYSNKKIQFGVNVTTSLKFEKEYSIDNIKRVRIKRINGVMYLVHDNEYIKTIDTSSLKNNPLDIPLTIGASLDANRKPFRYFNGTLSNIRICLYE